MTNQLPMLKMDTVVKLLTYPLTLGFSVRQFEDFVFSDFGQKLAPLETWNIVQICNYMSRQTELDRFPVTGLLTFLEDKLDNIRDLDELIEIIECFNYLAQMKVFSPKFNKLIFSEINALPSELFENKSDLPLIADSVSKVLFSKLNLKNASEEREKHLERNPNKTTSVFTRLPAFISSCYSLEAEVREAGAEVEAARAHAISRSHHAPLPREVLIPMLPAKVRTGD